jgi:hypothetical protein
MGGIVQTPSTPPLIAPEGAGAFQAPENPLKSNPAFRPGPYTQNYFNPFADNYPPLAHNHSMVNLIQEASQNRIDLRRDEKAVS